MLYPTVAVGWGTLPVRSKQNGKITNLHHNDIIGWSKGFPYPQCASQSLPTVAKLGTLWAKRLYLCVTVGFVTLAAQWKQTEVVKVRVYFRSWKAHIFPGTFSTYSLCTNSYVVSRVRVRVKIPCICWFLPVLSGTQNLGYNRECRAHPYFGSISPM
jgi:hypothetical protein